MGLRKQNGPSGAGKFLHRLWDYCDGPAHGTVHLSPEELLRLNHGRVTSHVPREVRALLLEHRRPRLRANRELSGMPGIHFPKRRGQHRQHHNQSPIYAPQSDPGGASLAYSYPVLPVHALRRPLQPRSGVPPGRICRSQLAQGHGRLVSGTGPRARLPEHTVYDGNQSKNSWEGTWARHWTPLSTSGSGSGAGNASLSRGSSSSSPSSDSGSSSSPSSLSTGARAGISVACAAGGVIIAAGLLFLYHCRRRTHQPVGAGVDLSGGQVGCPLPKPPMVPYSDSVPAGPIDHIGEYYAPQKTARPQEPQELDSNNGSHVHELHGH